MMLQGRVDIVPSDTQYGWHALKTDGDEWESVRTIRSDFFESKKLFPLFTRKNPAYAQFIADWDREIGRMVADGSLRDLHKKHGVAYDR